MALNYKDVILSIFIIFTGFGLLSPHEFNILNIKLLLEFLFLFLSLLSIKYIRKSLLVYFAVSFVYIIYSYTFVYINNDKITDFIMIYKTFIYILLLTFIVDKKIFDYKFIKSLFYMLITAIIIKYTYSLAFGFAHRPGLFTENNFELMFLLLLFIAKLHFEKKVFLIDYFLLVFILTISGSRSAILSLLAITLFMNFGNKKIYLYVKYILLVCMSLVVIFIIIIRMDNMNIEEIDRVRFLFVFLDEVSEWNFFNYLFGNEPMTPLSQTNCESLSYYKPLFSDKDSNLCYSVILHSYILRVLLDHGILGVLFIFSFLYKVLNIARFKLNEIFMIFSIIIVNSLSVSSLNSIFAIFGIMILLMLKESKYAKFK